MQFDILSLTILVMVILIALAKTENMVLYGL